MRRRPARTSCTAVHAATYFGVVMASAIAAPPAATGSGWDLVYADEFNGTEVDTIKWNIATPGWTMPNSDSTASAAQVSIDSGSLKLSATRPAAAASFSSGSVSTYQKYAWTGGYFEARILLPTTPGSWPAFWGLYTGWPPEADIMEYPLTTNGGTNGYPNTDYHTAFHYTNGSGNAAAGAGRVNPTSSAALNTGYHTFAMHWVDDTSVTFYFDGVQVSSFVNSAVSQMVNMYLILDYAVGGWPGTPSTTQWPVGHTDKTLIDYVRVWQQRPAGASTTSTWNINGGGTWTTSGNWSGVMPKFSGQSAIFPRVGTAATASIDWTNSLTVGSITFSGAATTTAYSLIGDAIQLAGSGGGGTSFIEAQASSQANQAISARLEFYNATELRNNMTGGQLLSLNGVLIGEGDVTVNGPGTVVFSNNNTYSGDTFIGSGQSAAVARVTRSRPFGETGTVTIGPSGNATTARIEIQDTRTVPNNINFSGRNNSSVGIQNLGGNNTFSGTITAQTGGGTYLIQSDSGTLTLSGTTGVSGVALRGNTGTRTFTLQGAGNGVVSGIIENGAGTAAITKAGTGTWTLSGVNTYTGATAVNAGTLDLDGVVAGAMTVASGATLTGGGSTNGSTSVNGTHRPGNGVGTQSFAGLSYGSTARLAWELGANSTTAGAFDKVTATGAVTVASGAALDISLTPAAGTVALNDVFWTQARTWTVLTGTSVTGSFTLGTVGNDSGGRPVSDYGVLSLQQTTTAVNVIFTPYTPTQKWQRANFGVNWNNAAVSGPTVDTDNDGLPNALEYSLASSPTVSTASAAPKVSVVSGRATITLTRNTDATDMTLKVFGADTPAGPWTELARSTGGTPFTVITAGATVNETGAGTTRTVQVGDLYPTSDPARPKRFLKLTVQ